MKSILCIYDQLAEMSEEQTEELINSLPRWRREQALRFKHLQGRRECAMGYSQLLLGLRERFYINDSPSFIYNEYGKPFLKGHPDLFFSISHCKEAVGCFIADQPCGLDIEYIRKAKPDLVRYTMNLEETEAIFSAESPDIAFTRFWTQKEAVLKLLGMGIIDDLHSVLETGNLLGIELETIENRERNYIYTKAFKS